MGKKSVVFCDLTKQEVEDDTTLVSITIKIPGKKTGRTYELSAASAATLERQLVSGKQLPAKWGFYPDLSDIMVPKPTGPQVMADLDTDAKFVSDKKREMKEQGVDLEPREKEDDQPDILPELSSGSSDCLHMNKGPIQATLSGGVRQIYRICRECHGRIPEKPKDERVAYLTAKAPTDSRVDYKD